MTVSLPELNPGTAPNLFEILDFHHALAALAHEFERAVEADDLDAVVRRGQHGTQETGILVELCRHKRAFESG